MYGERCSLRHVPAVGGREGGSSSGHVDSPPIATAPAGSTVLGGQDGVPGVVGAAPGGATTGDNRQDLLRVCVSPIDASVSNKSIKQLCEEVGRVSDVYVPDDKYTRKRGEVAFVKYTT
jgi:hypothetical protein